MAKQQANIHGAKNIHETATMRYMMREAIAAHTRVRLVQERVSRIVKLGPPIGPPSIVQSGSSVIVKFRCWIGGLQTANVQTTLQHLASLYLELPWVNKPTSLRIDKAVGGEADQFVWTFLWYAPTWQGAQDDIADADEPKPTPQRAKGSSEAGSTAPDRPGRRSGAGAGRLQNRKDVVPGRPVRRKGKAPPVRPGE